MGLMGSMFGGFPRCLTSKPVIKFRIVKSTNRRAVFNNSNNNNNLLLFLSITWSVD
jgi:hypothetical protein